MRCPVQHRVLLYRYLKRLRTIHSNPQRPDWTFHVVVHCGIISYFLPNVIFRVGFRPFPLRGSHTHTHTHFPPFLSLGKGQRVVNRPGGDRLSRTPLHFHFKVDSKIPAQKSGTSSGAVQVISPTNEGVYIQKNARCWRTHTHAEDENRFSCFSSCHSAVAI